MADKDETVTPEPDRSSINVWLNDVLSPPATGTKPLTHKDSSLSPKAFLNQLAFKTDFRVPNDAELTGVEIREVPEKVYAASGEMLAPGTWLFDCDHLDSVNFYADDTTGLRHTTAVVGKFMLKRSEDQRIWSEIEASRLVLVENTISTSGDVGAIDRTSAAAKESCVAQLIDLDVNIDLDDAEEQMNSRVTFSGLPDGAILTSGTMDTDDVWTIPQSDLNDLSIIVPLGTPSFDLELTLITDGADNAVASMSVELPAEGPDSTGNSLMLRFSPPATQSPHQFRVFADGSEIFDRVILWSGDPDVPVDLHVPLPDDEDLPFELLIREDALDHAKIQQAVVLAAEFNDRPIRLDADLIRGNVTIAPSGLSWSGDLILLARDLAAQIIPIEHVSVDTPSEPEGEPSSAVTSDSDAAKPEQATGEASNVLTINISSSDIDSPGFVEELGALQDFLQGLDGEVTEANYDRLNLRVTNWRDLDVFGPTGARVDLNPALPRLAPTGGRDNKLQTVRLGNALNPTNDFNFVEVHGLPGACLLTNGKNLGDGRWRLAAEEAMTTKIVCLSSTGATIAKIDACSDDESRSSHTLGEVLVGGQSRMLKSSVSSSGVISVPLEQGVFDPEGHGSLSLTVGDVPPGVLLISGKNHGDGIWTYETRANDKLGFQLMAPKSSFTVSITCVAMNEETGDSTVVTQHARVRPDRMEAMLDQAVNA